ncbi:UrcA family protein [Croceicoccus gelatinilyticus]|uniref:UrcA family protein n=1 Tax=Croceicoccus gelatinilyticus TaxID=2835536 RepID=UPI001BCE383A|nr:UrcA family protein [Croceicoccus gelatinilyticus]MBS7671180.1 UrcA family protein [Croceicoccus gelatinilyticus]
MLRRASLITLGYVAAIFAANAFAEPVTVTATKVVRVSYADLRLDTDDGQKTLRQRAREAGKEVCGFNEWPLEMSVVRHTCLRAVMRNADGQIEVATRQAVLPPALATGQSPSREIVLAVAR